MAQDDTFMTPKQLGERWKISDDNVRQMLDEGIVPSIPVGVGSRRQARRIPRRAVTDYEREHLGADAAGQAAVNQLRRSTDPKPPA